MAIAEAAPVTTPAPTRRLVALAVGLAHAPLSDTSCIDELLSAARCDPIVLLEAERALASMAVDERVLARACALVTSARLRASYEARADVLDVGPTIQTALG